MTKLNEKGTYVSIVPVSIPSNLSLPNLLKKITDLRKEQDLLCLQIIRLDYVAGKEHILSAAWHAFKAFESQRNIAKSLETEFLLYLSGQRQIKKAIELMGLHNTTDKTALIIISAEMLESQTNLILSKLDMNYESSISLDLTEEKKELIKRTLPLGNTPQSFEDRILQMVALTALQGK